ncbi:UDP-glucuronic acid decarboxylase family protein [Haloechinothrix salitolerans]|uniref:UDP-glucuronic acid decarboxylase family protein n=1 Tax=Haloechinothrix salitolerans TaxID=926830 RepID=A0ABW2C2X4_9PSEU
MISRRFERALVTGGGGFVGSHLCDRLLRDGTEVVCVDDLCTGTTRAIAWLLRHDGFRFLEHDVAGPLPPLDRFDLVAHLASPASPVDYLRLPLETLRTGADGTRHALELARTSSARFLLASTSEVYGDPLEHPQRETYWGNVNPIGPRSVYDEAKRYAEALTAAYHREYGTDVAIARIFNTYGPGMRADDGRMVPTFVRQALAGEPVTVHGDGTQTRSLCYVDDTVDGLLALAASAEHEPVNIGNPDELQVITIADEVRRLAGRGSPVRHVAADPDDPRQRCPDITRARAVLGWSPRTDLTDGLRRTIGWFADADVGDVQSATRGE